MAVKRWTGNGLADLTTITAGNINQAGNGDTVIRAVSGTPSIYRTEGDGFRAAGNNTVIARVDSGAGTVSGFGAVAQFFFTPSGVQASGVELPLVFKNTSGGDIARLATTTARLIRLQNNASTTVGPAPAAYVDGHRYQVDVIAQVKTSGASSTNGRAVVRIRSLNSPTWNGTGDFYYDSGESLNLGTAQLNATQAVRVGKQVTATPTPAGGHLFEQFGWDNVSLPAAVTTRAAVEAYFIPSPYFTPVGYFYNGTALVPQRGYLWNGTAYVEQKRA